MVMGKAFRSNYIFEKAKRYCAYQERSVLEVNRKLKEWKVKSNKADKIIHMLLEENFLNEERFARIYASGKFRIKKWGKLKITAQLRARNIPDNIILQALEEINEEDYINTLISVIEKKKLRLKDPDGLPARNKVINYALSRGFEKHLIFKYL